MTVKYKLLKENISPPSWVMCCDGQRPTISEYKRNKSKYDPVIMKHGIYSVEMSVYDIHFWQYSNNQRSEFEIGNGSISLPISMREIFSFVANDTIQVQKYGHDVIVTIIGQFEKNGQGIRLTPLKDLSSL